MLAWRSATLLKRDFNTGVFPRYCEIFNNTYFEEHFDSVEPCPTSKIEIFGENGSIMDLWLGSKYDSE